MGCVKICAPYCHVWFVYVRYEFGHTELGCGIYDLGSRWRPSQRRSSLWNSLHMPPTAEREKSSESVLYAAAKQRQYTRKGKGKQKEGKPKHDDICRGCGEQGHWVNRCPNRKTNEKGKEK